MKNLLIRLSILSFASFAIGCSTQHQQPSQENLDSQQKSLPVSQEQASGVAEKKAPEDKPAEYAEFDPETMYALLTAEIAAQRGRYDITLLNYVQQARNTKDVAVIERAFRVAQYLKADNAQLQVSKVWAEADPENVEANQLAAFHHARNKQYEAAMGYMEQTIQLGGNAGLDRLAAHSKTLLIEEQKTLLRLYRAAHERHPNNREVTYSLAVIEKNLGDTDQAIMTLAPLLESEPDFEPAILLQAGLLYDKKQISEAAHYLGEQSERFPENRKMGTLYGRLLIDDKQLDKAQDVFQDLMERFPEVAGLRLSYALVSLENDDIDEAIDQFNILLEEQQHTNEAHFYLGRIADTKGDTQQAIEHYLKVESGTHFYSSLSRASYLTAKDGHLDDALIRLDALRQQLPEQAQNFWLIEVDLLLDLNEKDLALGSTNLALIDFPENTKLLYSRAMLLDHAGRADEMEADLRFIIKLEPNNVVALNALGYTLADKTDQLIEAFELISKAHELNPKNPAILDSMGWVYYRMGNYEESLKFLNKAYIDFPDPEVAAHLGEVLWQSGNKARAIKIWNEGLEKEPDSKLVIDAMARFGLSPGDTGEPNLKP